MDKEKECEHINIHAEYQRIIVSGTPPGLKSEQTFVVIRCAMCHAFLRVLTINELK